MDHRIAEPCAEGGSICTRSDDASNYEPQYVSCWNGRSDGKTRPPGEARWAAAPDARASARQLQRLVRAR